MALKFLFFNLFTAMVAVNFIIADEDSERAFGLPFFGNGSGLPNLPFFGGGGNGSGIPNLPFFGGQLPSFFGSRQERSAEHQEDEEEHQERLFFGSLVGCNYTTQGGTTCSSCRQSLACFPNNVGRVRTCRGFLRYCNNGRCSFVPGAQCSSSSSSSDNSSSGNSSSGNATG